jgi:hypothetical protein
MKRLACVLLMILVLTLSGTAFAASIATSTAELDWDSLSLTNAMITYYYDYSYGYAYDNGTSAQEDKYDEGSGPPTTYAYAQVGDTWARGQTSPSLIEETVYARSENYIGANNYAYAYREAYFTADKDGLVTAQINYLLSMLLSTDFSGDNANAYAGYYFELYKEEGNGYDEEYRDKQVGIVNRDGYSYYNTGTTPLLELPFKAGEEGVLYAEVYNCSNAYGVPVPGTILLLGSGMIGLVGLRKRVRKG